MIEYKTLLKSSVAATALVLAPASMVSAAPFDIAGPTASVIDSDPGSPTELTFNVSETGIINSFGVRVEIGCGDDCLSDEGGTYWDNLSFTVSHDSESALLFDLETDDAGSESLLDVTFEDGFAVLTVGDIVSGGTTSGTFGPDEPLSVFHGLELSGDWTFTIFDNAGYEYDGTELLSSSIFGTVRDEIEVPAPAGVGLLGLGLLGLGALRRRKAVA